MAGNAHMKQKLLVLRELLERFSDEDHPLSAPELCAMLQQKGIPANRKSIYDDIQALREFGLDIMAVTLPKRGYYLASRPFETPQVRLLMDAVRTAGFITAKKTRDLIARLGTLTSVYQRQDLLQQIYVDESHKQTNEEIYYSIDALSRAIAARRRVSLQYTRRRLAAGGRSDKITRTFVISPYAMMWSRDHYYLIGNLDKYDNLIHLRIDRMKKVAVLEEPARSFEEVCDYRGRFDTADYASKIFQAYGGEVEQVALRCHNDLLDEMLDRFGAGLRIRPSGEDHFTFEAPMVVSEGLISTVLSFGDRVEVLTPRELRQQIADAVVPLTALYGLEIR